MRLVSAEQTGEAGSEAQPTLYGDCTPVPEVITTEIFLSPDPPVLAPAYGVGVDSTALIIGLKRRGIRPDVILYGTPGSDKRVTYRYLPVFNEWLRSVDFPEVTVVRKASPKTGDVSLEGECLRTGYLPSLAYGRHDCSSKWKAAAQQKFLNNWEPARLSWRRGRKVVRAIGYEADECGRIKKAQTYQAKKPDKKFLYWHPLAEWGWTREDCVEVIKSEGLPVPSKSACFMCPASKKWEIEQLAATDPDLFLRALQLEHNAAARSRTMKGLGRSFAWRDLPVAAPFLARIEGRIDRDKTDIMADVAEELPELKRAA